MFLLNYLSFFPQNYSKDLYYFCVYTGILKLENLGSEEKAFMALKQRLDEEIQDAKSEQLLRSEVLLPSDLLGRIAQDSLNMAENEPCALRLVFFLIFFWLQKKPRIEPYSDLSTAALRCAKHIFVLKFRRWTGNILT